MGTNLFSFVIVLGILIFFHELGHFLVARLFGVGVEKFSLGFGPRIFGRKIGITDYRLSAIPLGGYVKMVGEEPDAELDPKDIPISFTHKHLAKKFCIVAAGPLFNLVLALIIFFILFLVSGTYILKPTIGEIIADSPAYKAGLQNKDMIIAIDGTSVVDWEDMAKMITNCNGRDLSLTVKRQDELLEINIRPERSPGKNIFGEDIQRYVIGIASAGDVYQEKLSVFRSFTESIAQTYGITKLTIISIIKLIQGTVSTKTLGGPIMIAEMAGQQARQGVMNLVFFIALLSINLAILNFLPIPVLDGGHLMFFLIEAIMGRPVNNKTREVAQQVGIFILIMLMVFVFYNDIARIFFS